MGYRVADVIYGLSIEPGDHIRTAAGNDFIVSLVEDVEGGYDIHYIDPFTEEDEMMYFLEQDDTVELLVIDN